MARAGLTCGRGWIAVSGGFRHGVRSDHCDPRELNPPYKTAIMATLACSTHHSTLLNPPYGRARAVRGGRFPAVFFRIKGGGELFCLVSLMILRSVFILALLIQQSLALPCAAWGASECGGSACRAEDQGTCCCGPEAAARCECKPAPAVPPANSDRWQIEIATALALPTGGALFDSSPEWADCLTKAVGVWEAAPTSHERCVLLCRWLT